MMIRNYKTIERIMELYFKDRKLNQKFKTVIYSLIHKSMIQIENILKTILILANLIEI